MKRCAINTYNHCIYLLPHALPNDFRLSILGKWKDSLVPSFSVKMKVLLILAKKLQKMAIKFFRSALFRMKTRITLKHFVSYCLSKHFSNANSHKTLKKLFYLKILVTLSTFTLFQSKVLAIKLQKARKICLQF